MKWLPLFVLGLALFASSCSGASEPDSIPTLTAVPPTAAPTPEDVGQLLEESVVRCEDVFVRSDQMVAYETGQEGPDLAGSPEDAGAVEGYGVVCISPSLSVLQAREFAAPLSLQIDVYAFRTDEEANRFVDPITPGTELQRGAQSGKALDLPAGFGDKSLGIVLIDGAADEVTVNIDVVAGNLAARVITIGSLSELLPESLGIPTPSVGERRDESVRYALILGEAWLENLGSGEPREEPSVLDPMDGCALYIDRLPQAEGFKANTGYTTEETCSEILEHPDLCLRLQRDFDQHGFSVDLQCSRE